MGLRLRALLRRVHHPHRAERRLRHLQNRDGATYTPETFPCTQLVPQVFCSLYGASKVDTLSRKLTPVRQHTVGVSMVFLGPWLLAVSTVNPNHPSGIAAIHPVGCVLKHKN